MSVDRQALLDFSVEGLTVLEIMRRMKTADGRRSLSTRQLRFGEAVRRDEVLYEIVKSEFENERKEKEM